MSTGTKPRDAALDILRAVRSGKRFDQALDTAVPRLTDPDRRLAHEIAAGVLRKRTDLDRRIAAALTKPGKRLPDDVRDVLRIGVYQLSYLDRVPPYAAVQSAVELVKDECGAKYAPFVNALLRKLTRLENAEDPGAPETGLDLAERYSHPDWLVERWVDRFGSVETQRLLKHNNKRPPLVIQPARWTEGELLSALVAAAVEHQPGPLGYGFTVTGRGVKDLPGYAEGGFIVQDSSQRRLVDYIAAPAGARIWDACAAPGGKAAVLARTCAVLASDVSRRRISRLRENLTRVAPEARMIAADARFPPIHHGRIDIALIDAPCSGTGTFARHPDARWRLSRADINALVGVQSELLAGAATTVPAGGLLVYLTCSLEPEENEHQVSEFLLRYPDFSREGEDLSLLPWKAGCDGGFGARLRRAA